jgi:hypothetical protein
VIIGLVVAAVVLPQRLWRRLRPQSRSDRQRPPRDSSEHIKM